MVSPLINALAPAIDFVVDKFVVLLNTMNQLFAKLTGADTYTAAKKVSTQWADAESSVKESVKAIKRYTLGFDELNILGKNKDSTDSSSNKDTTDYASMFETLPVDSAIGSFVERLKAAFQSENWKESGSIIGGKINEGVDNIDWGGIGTSIGKKINGSVQTAYYTLDTINFTNIGAKIATLLNNALSEIDFEFVGRLIVKPFTSLGSTIIGFVTELDWGAVARSISDCVKGIFDECSKWLDSVDWDELGSELWTDISDFLITKIWLYLVI